MGGGLLASTWSVGSPATASGICLWLPYRNTTPRGSSGSVGWKGKALACLEKWVHVHGTWLVSFGRRQVPSAQASLTTAAHLLEMRHDSLTRLQA